jgi:hypothetical protein
MIMEDIMGYVRLCHAVER